MDIKRKTILYKSKWKAHCDCCKDNTRRIGNCKLFPFSYSLSSVSFFRVLFHFSWFLFVVCSFLFASFFMFSFFLLSLSIFFFSFVLGFSKRFLSYSGFNLVSNHFFKTTDCSTGGGTSDGRFFAEYGCHVVELGNLFLLFRKQIQQRQTQEWIKKKRKCELKQRKKREKDSRTKIFSLRPFFFFHLLVLFFVSSFLFFRL